MNNNIKGKLENFLMGEDLIVENVEEKEKQLEFDFSKEEKSSEGKGKTEDDVSPVIIDRKVITESGKILLKD